VRWACREPTPPDVLIKTTTTEVIDIIKSDKEIQAGNKKKIKT